MTQQFGDVHAAHGAPMGRVDYKGDYEFPYKLALFQVRMVDGDYDDGGAYWGGGMGLDPLYCARCEAQWDAELQDDAPCVRMFIRAPNREAAKKMVLETYHNARFYR